MSITFKKGVSEVAQKDILELTKKIEAFKAGSMDEDKFRAFRLTRGVYGQRQVGVQMIRIKIPYGKLTTAQLLKIAEASDTYASGNLHITTRQDIQLHFVKVEDSPKVWAILEEEGVTLREACGNTVRNVTASPDAGINPDELFDITPYADALVHYLLRNPICQDMGRKIKIAFSSTDQDSALVFIHDFGYIPAVKDGVKGFKIVIAGGLGAQAIMAQDAFNFIALDEYIPFTEAAIRVFDRYGEREKRFKARMKFLVKDLGLEEFMRLVKEEMTAVSNLKIVVDPNRFTPAPAPTAIAPSVSIKDKAAYDLWEQTNVFEQKQKGQYGVWVRVPLGDMKTDKTRAFVAAIKGYVAEDIRTTINQGYLLKGIKKENLPYIYTELNKLELAAPGFDSTHDITSCPGSDTCNLAVTNSTHVALELEKVMKEEYPEFIHEKNLKIKMSGCMNGCGQHMIANIGFHGSSIKNGTLVAPAMQVVLGGGVDNGQGFIADKIVKIPSKKLPDGLRLLLNDYKTNGKKGENFNTYYNRQNQDHYFYNLLKPLADTNILEPEDYIDWGKEINFKPEIGTGECAGVSLDVIGTVINESEEKTQLAELGLNEDAYADSIYNSYTSMVIGAKAMLLSIDAKCNTHSGIIKDFNEQFIKNEKLGLTNDFEEFVLKMSKNKPSKAFAESYLKDAKAFLEVVKLLREKQVAAGANPEKRVIEHYYKG